MAPHARRLPIGCKDCSNGNPKPHCEYNAYQNSLLEFQGVWAREWTVADWNDANIRPLDSYICAQHADEAAQRDHSIHRCGVQLVSAID